jgi:hypothetical protein
MGLLNRLAVLIGGRLLPNNLTYAGAGAGDGTRAAELLLVLKASHLQRPY